MASLSILDSTTLNSFQSSPCIKNLQLGLLVLILLLPIVVGCAGAPTQEVSEIEGVVRKDDGSPVPHAWVQLLQHPAPNIFHLLTPTADTFLSTTQTDSKGRFTIQLPAGTRDRLAVLVRGKIGVKWLTSGTKEAVMTDVEQENPILTGINVVKVPLDFVPATRSGMYLNDLPEFK
jgi:hypothetical protein